ncbi:MAG TPA: hypothetical protein VFI43_07770 [Nitrosospira sp.]|nr:hypothetical protein [Nitrosospira sp.]
MLETEKLDKLSCLLKEMTRPGISQPKAAPLLIMERQIAHSMIGFLLLLGFAYFSQSEGQRLFGITPLELHDALLIVQWPLIACFVFFLVMLTRRALYIRRHRKELVPFPFLYPPQKSALHRDAEFITQLLRFDKATLAYGLLQYSHRWSSPEGRAAVFVGDLRKLGLVPTVVALFISVAMLFKGDSSPFLLFLQDLVVIVIIYYVAAFLGFLSRERPQQVIQLLEYAIQHADQCNATPHDAIASAPSD